MPRLEARWSGAEADADLFRPRRDLVLEAEDGPGRFVQAEGPFRQLRADGAGRAGRLDHRDHDLSAGHPVVRLGIRAAHPAQPAARARVTAPTVARSRGGHLRSASTPRSAHVLGLLAAAQLTTGFCNTLFSQTVAFAADEFGASEGAQGVAGSVVRVGIILTVLLLALADRVGRRRILVGTAVAAPLLAAVGAFAPSLAVLAGMQTIARPVAISLGLVVTIVAAEEMPPGSRAYAVSVLGLAYALGAGTCVWALPLADLGSHGWRLIYMVGLVYLVVAVSLYRGVPESRRYELPHAERPTLPGRRFLLLAASAFLYNLLIASTTFYENRYLKDVRGYSATLIAIYTIVTSTPGAIGVLAGGRLADVKGRRLVGTIALISVAIGNVIVFSIAGPGLWGAKLVTTILAGMAVPALGVYAAELFPTSRRGGANGGISALSVVGSVVGLLLAGLLLDQGVTYGRVMAVLAVGPLIYAALVVFAYPETARRSLDDINPEDRATAA